MSAKSRPAGVSPEILMAPARGQLYEFRETETVMTPNGPRLRYATEHGLRPARVGDAFDTMLDQAARRAGKDALPPFSFDQIEAGRAYAKLAERVAAAGVQCSSIEAQARGSGGGSWIDAVLHDSRRLDVMRSKVGADLVLEPRGAAAHRDRGRRAITVRDLVDAVCLEGRTLSGVLARFGWGRNTRNVKALRDALCAALDRLGNLI